MQRITIQKFPQPLNLVAFQTITDTRGRSWTVGLVDPWVGSSSTWVIYRGDIPGPYPLSIDKRGSSSAMRWYKGEGSDFTSICRFLRENSVDPTDGNFITGSIKLGPISLSRKSAPSWGEYLARTAR